MTFSSTTNRTVGAAGDGVTVAFSYPYLFLDEDHLTVILREDNSGDEDLQTITTHYTVTGEGNPAGGTVTMVTAPPVGKTLFILNEPNQNQEIDYTNNSTNPSDTIEKSMDKVAMILQSVDEQAGRTLQLKDTTLESAPTLEDLSGDAKKLLAVNTTEDGFTNTANSSPVTSGGFQRRIFSGDGGTTDFSLGYTPANGTLLFVVVDDVIQEPTVDYTVSATTLSFTSAPASGTDNIYIINFGSGLGATTPSDKTASNAKFADDSVIASNIPSLNITGTKTAIGAIDSRVINDGDIDNTLIGSNVITSSKLASTALTGQSSATAATGDYVLFGDSTDSNNVKKDTIQGILDIESGGTWQSISTQTASNSADIQFTSGIDSTYRWYVVVIESVIPATDGAALELTVSTDGGSTYLGGTNYQYHQILSRSSSSSYTGSNGNSSADIRLSSSYGTGTGESGSTVVYIDNPSQTSVYKNVFSEGASFTSLESATNNITGALIQTSSAVDAIKFAMHTGNITSGTFKLYGIE